MAMNHLNTMRTVGLSLLLSAPMEIYGAITRKEPLYRVRATIGEKPSGDTAEFDPLDLLLSFSDDGLDREDEFLLDIFDTPALLTNAESPMVISDAMNEFLLAELQGRFGNMNSVEKVSSEILNLNERNGTYVNDFGVEDTRVGTEAKMKVVLSFELTPSPKKEEVVDLLRIIMSDLSYFVSNVTTSVPEDHELSGVYEAIRREIPRSALLQPPENIVVDISEPNIPSSGNGTDESSRKLVYAAVPIVLVVAVLAAVIVFFAFKKKKVVEPESDKGSVMMMPIDVENDVYSVDQSVESTDTSKAPVSMLGSMKLEESSMYSMSVDSGLLPSTPKGGDSVFSGIDTAFTGSVLSPRSLSSPKSMMTGLTCASASTIQASNVNKTHSKKKSAASPVGGSVFSFLDPIKDTEEEEEDVDDLDAMEQAQGTEDKAYSEKSGNSTDDTESSSSLEGVAIKLPRTETSEPVSHVLADLENMEARIASVPRDGTHTNVDRIAPEGGTEATGVASIASSFMNGLFGGSRKSLSTPNSPTSGPVKNASRSAPGSPVRQIGRHWMTANKMGLKIPTSPKYNDTEDYEMNLSNPSLDDEDDESGGGLDDSINNSTRIVDKAPQDSPDAYGPGGRRHAGDKIGGDGSALYQASAMRPTDWSCKSSDAESVGASTIDEETIQPHHHNSLLSQANVGTVHENRQLINDLVWLEKKIATVRGEEINEAGDSLSYASNDNHEGMETSNDDSGMDSRDPSNIVCRDCIAPPGKLKVIIHSTKDGPAVHTVKEGSCLQGQVFSGDLIISVDNVDTRAFTAEEVMKLMASKSKQERKITVLHFEEA